MIAPTHVVGGISVMAFFALLVPAYRLDWVHILVGAFCAMLPDIDNPKAFIGRIFFFVSGPLDRTLGHRTFTHSFLAMFLLGAVSFLSLFLYSRSLLAPMPLTFTFMLAYFSHIFFDSMTKQGVLAYYPSRLWGVFPLRHSWRIRTGSRIEILYFTLFTVAALILLPLGQSGVVHAFNRLFQSGGIEIRLKEFEIQKQKVSLGFTVAQLDSLLKVGAIDPKQAEEIKSALLKIEVEEQKFRRDQGLE
jgi:membrane-bound metal-dependent hydrolase YbcI (DUF457 family)